MNSIRDHMPGLVHKVLILESFIMPEEEKGEVGSLREPERK